MAEPELDVFQIRGRARPSGRNWMSMTLSSIALPCEGAGKQIASVPALLQCVAELMEPRSQRRFLQRTVSKFPAELGNVDHAKPWPGGADIGRALLKVIHG